MVLAHPQKSGRSIVPLPCIHGRVCRDIGRGRSDTNGELQDGTFLGDETRGRPDVRQYFFKSDYVPNLAKRLQDHFKARSC